MKRTSHTAQAQLSRRDALALVQGLVASTHGTTARAAVVVVVASKETAKITPRWSSGGLLTEGAS